MFKWVTAVILYNILKIIFLHMQAHNLTLTVAEY